MTSGINRAIADSHRDGIVTSATLMATGQAFEEAAALAQRTSSLGVGCHVSLVQGESLLPIAQVSTLAHKTVDGKARLRSGFPQFAGVALTGRLDPAEIAKEARAQFQRLQAAGIPVTHFDTHKHVHLFPTVLAPLLEAARECGIRAVRCPFEPAWAVPLAEIASKKKLWKRLPVVALLRRFHPDFRRLVSHFGLASPEGTVGISATGCLDESLLQSLLRRLPEGTWELVCHPAYQDDRLRTLSTLRTGEAERQALTSRGIHDCIRECGIQLISYSALTDQQHAASTVFPKGARDR